MIRRETGYNQVQALRQQATLWREPQDDAVQLNSRKINPQQFRKNNSHLYSNSKHDDKENPIWDDNGCLLNKPEKKSSGLKRSASVASLHSNLYPNQKSESNSRKVRKDEEDSYLDDSENESKRLTTKQRQRKKQQDSILRLTTKKTPQREKSVQPRLLSTDFEGFIHRQTDCVKAHNKKPKPVQNYKIDISEGTKKLLKRSQKLSSHSIYDLKPREKRDEEFEICSRSGSSLSARPKMKKQEWRLSNMDVEKERELKEDRMTILRAKIDAEENRSQKSNEKVKPKINSRSSSRYYQNEEPYIPQKYQPNSVYQTRKRIELKINEMKPILEAEQNELNWNTQEKKNKNKKKIREYVPDYMQTINDVISPSWDDDKKRNKKRDMFLYYNEKSNSK